MSGSKPGQPIENIDGVGCVGFEAGFSREEKKDRADSTEHAASDQPGDIPEHYHDDRPEDRTCAQCRGEIDGKERLVSVSGRAVWLHLECERFWVRALNAGRGPEKAPVAPPASSRSFRIKGPAGPDAACIFCCQDNGEEVLRIVGPEAGSKSETLHAACAPRWFAALRNFETGPADDDNSWQGQA